MNLTIANNHSTQVNRPASASNENISSSILSRHREATTQL